MKKYLPKLTNKPRGFTLIELLVVVAIIAILAVIAMVLFTGVQSRARDARRQSDVTAIAKAMEANKVPGSNNYPQTLVTWFAGGISPVEGAADRNYIIVYSVAAGVTAVVEPTAWAAATPPANPTAVVGTTVATFGGGIPATGNITAFQICALLEAGVNPGNIFCVPNAQ